MNTVENAYADALRAKIVTMVSLFSISMFCGCVPMLISVKYDWFTKSGPDMRSNRLVFGLLAFGGGVLFATSFLHLLPEVDENIKLLQASGDLPDIPLYLAALIMCSGFFMMYLIEELVHAYIHSREKSKDKNFKRVLSVKRHSVELCDTIPVVVERENTSNNHGHLQVPTEDDGVVAALRGLLIVLALSVHELFEGLAVGLESSASNVWYMFGAVSAHKYIIAFCIGVELLAARTKRWLSVMYVFTFSFVSALGIGIGILLVGGAGAADAGIYSVILQGLAAGTLVYVVFFEVWRHDQSGLMQFTCALTGFVLMALLELLVALFVE